MPAAKTLRAFGKHNKSCLLLEDELRAELHRALVTRVIDLTIHRAGNVRAREGCEVCVVKDIENDSLQLAG